MGAVKSVKVHVLNCHAGITEANIRDFVLELMKLALKGEVWGFLDEINACDHLGLINSIICHRQLEGKLLHPNIVLMAACNPYEKRKFEGLTAGLHSHRVRADPMAQLTYRVHPLPETMLDYVWDFGMIDQNEEKKYIKAILQGTAHSKIAIDKTDLVTEVLSVSQQYIRDHSEGCFVSLRDVRRSVDLLPFFDSFFEKRKSLATRIMTFFGGFGDVSVEGVPVRALVLSLAHCYHSRLTRDSDRVGYRAVISAIFEKHKLRRVLNEEKFVEIVREEQQDMFERMDKRHWPNTAPNSALLENVFSVVVCILTKMPIFVVGKPGNSKSLAIQLINSSLRGPDSQDPLFKLLPGVNFVSYQVRTLSRVTQRCAHLIF